MEASRKSGQGAGARARIYDAVATASDSEREVDGPASAAPELTEQLRERMDEVRGRLRALADAAATPESPDARRAWPPPDPRDAVSVPPPDVPTVTVREDLLQRIRDELVATRALIVRTSTALARSVSGAAGRAPRQRPAGAADPVGASPLSSDRDKACMVALNMALNGASRAEADRYLAEHFALPDALGIVSDAYAHCARMRANGRNGDAARPG